MMTVRLTRAEADAVIRTLDRTRLHELARNRLHERPTLRHEEAGRARSAPPSRPAPHRRREEPRHDHRR